MRAPWESTRPLVVAAMPVVMPVELLSVPQCGCQRRRVSR
jgi:hypothetical protein